jgi:hypothetical protein
MKSDKVIYLALVVAIGVAFAGVFALERTHHGKAKAIRSGGKNIVRNVSFARPPGEMPLGETTQKINPIPAKSLPSPSP